MCSLQNLFPIVCGLYFSFRRFLCLAKNRFDLIVGRVTEVVSRDSEEVAGVVGRSQGWCPDVHSLTGTCSTGGDGIVRRVKEGGLQG
jgi:hypothetical protein